VTHPAIRDLFQSLSRDPAFQEVVSRLLRDPQARQSLSGLTTTAKALYIVLLWQATERNVIVVVDGNKQAETLSELVDTFFDVLVTSDLPRPQTIPAMDVLPAQRMSPHSEISEQRAIGLWRMASRKTSITITPVASALLRTEAAEFYRQLALTLRVGEEIPLELLLAHLESIGYEKRDPVEMVGEYSLRGGILDIFPAEASKPIRIELFGDLIESIRRFDVETQRSVMKVTEASLLPLAEYPKSRALFLELADQMDVPSPGDPFPGWEFAVPLVRPRKYSLFSLTENPLVLIDEPEQAAAASERLWKRLDEKADEKSLRPFPCPPDANFYTWPELRAALEGNAELALRQLEVLANPQSLTANPTTVSRPSLAFHGNIQAAIGEARNLVERGYRVVFFAKSSGELERLADIFQEYAVPFQLGLDPADATRP
jgi:transcription-repair coupling factor (superfamily II helicase)